MADKIEMSLDDIINSQHSNSGFGNNRTNGRTGRGRHHSADSRLPHPRRNIDRSGVLKGGIRGGIQRPRYQSQNTRFIAAEMRAFESTKLRIANLESSVSEWDIKELFLEFGPIKSAVIHYDRSGVSRGTADVEYERRDDAIRAMKQYNGVPLDGRPMSVELAISDTSAFLFHSSATQTRPYHDKRRSIPPKRRGDGGFTRGSKSNYRNDYGSRRGQTNRYNGNRGSKPGPHKRTAKTAEELDAELEAYKVTNGRKTGTKTTKPGTKTAEELDAELEAYRNEASKQLGSK
ncbi:THO complex subunit 4-like [Toxorhynchites rutilus septentrionalis]|uniref:THO complex subunit 4-like n=1 Tax=Toxorhynchites rutilus septentrionalis TaxID=329112 RepID=UPI002478EC80|nr:THO complex subunit 4-like [Toxorhynchites rutilus septentrionalis]